ncbi:MAG TPA: nucleotide exchange factor GrpE [Kofleriaceae bacterium]|nr:nucleotide exchange factor GrpE [Kofleriaceae bacterium]
MSGEPKQHEQTPDQPSGDAGAGSSSAATDGDVIPVEVVAPDDAVTANAESPVAALEAKLAAAEKEKKENWDRYLRAAADLENTRKRQKRELEDTRFDTKSKVLKEMLPVVDNLERAIEHAQAKDGGTNAIVEGVQLVLRQFMTAFERLDVVPIEAANQPFDPNLHEAISQQESDATPGTVVQVLQRGYRSGDRLLRPALVVVAKTPSAKSE